jgi:hypothetical protein
VPCAEVEGGSTATWRQQLEGLIAAAAAAPCTLLDVSDQHVNMHFFTACCAAADVPFTLYFRSASAASTTTCGSYTTYNKMRRRRWRSRLTCSSSLRSSHQLLRALRRSWLSSGGSMGVW